MSNNKCAKTKHKLIYGIGKTIYAKLKTQPKAVNKKAKTKRKEDANTKTTRDVLSKRKPKPSA